MAKKIKKPTAEWFIKPTDGGHTNEVIANHLATYSSIDEVKTEFGWTYRCSYEEIKYFQECKEKFKLKFDVFKKRNKSDKTEKVNLG